MDPDIPENLENDKKCPKKLGIWDQNLEFRPQTWNFDPKPRKNLEI